MALEKGPFTVYRTGAGQSPFLALRCDAHPWLWFLFRRIRAEHDILFSERFLSHAGAGPFGI